MWSTDIFSQSVDIFQRSFGDVIALIVVVKFETTVKVSVTELNFRI